MNEAVSRKRVGVLVRERRLELGKSQAEFAQDVGVDVKTFRSLETGERWPREVTRRKIEEGLGWPSDWLERSLETGETPEALPQDARSRYEQRLTDHVYGYIDESSARLRSQLDAGVDPKKLGEKMLNLIVGVRAAFECVDAAMELEASPDEAERFVDGAIGLLISSGALQVAGHLGTSTAILDEYGAAKDLIRDSRRAARASTAPGPADVASAASSRNKEVPIDADATQADYDLAGGVAYRRGMTEERQRRLRETEPEDIADDEGPEHGA